MPCSHDATLEKGECRFHGVCVHVAVRVFPRVIDGLVKILLHLVKRVGIDGRFVSHNDFDVPAHVGVDNLAHGSRLGILGPNQAEIAVALPDADYYGLVGFWTPSPSFAANVGFINLDCSAELGRGHFQHRGSDSVAQIPCRLIANPERALNLAGGYSLFRFAEQGGCKEPFPQGQVRIVENGIHGHTELVLA